MRSLKTIEEEIKAKEKEIDDMIEQFQKAVWGLARRGYKLHDETDPSFFLNGNVKYDKESMKLLVEFDTEAF